MPIEPAKVGTVDARLMEELERQHGDEATSLIEARRLTLGLPRQHALSDYEHQRDARSPAATAA
jgi:hypothetical protein